MSKSKIEWTDTTWNPLTGCTKISPGCTNCYAESMAKRLKAMGNPNYKNGFQLTLHPHTLSTPFNWKKPSLVFVNSMSDLFHEDVPLHYIQKVFKTMGTCNQHIFQVLTKRSSRLKKISSKLIWYPNIWMGVSIENQDYIYRANNLVSTNAAVKFLSLEPLLGPINNLPLNSIDWIIVGGESGPKSRKMESKWAEDIRDECISKNTPFFFKQWGGTNKKKTGRLLNNKLWDEYPQQIEALNKE
nr:phage Gp37/Gp68 family protein [uncultured Pseudodesulfovibrio sp.]